MEKVIVYPNDTGGVAVLTPCLDCGLTVQQIAAKDVPPGKPFKIMNKADLPAHDEFFDAWEYTP